MTTIMKVTPNGDGIAFGDIDAESNKIKANTNFYIQNPDGGGVNLFLDRPKSTAASWKIQNRGGDFVVQCDYLNASGKGSYYDVFKMQFDSGNLLLKAPLPISSGGTGANNTATASKNLLQLSNNVITSTSNDTVANWAAKGHCISFYTATGQLNNQPSQHGILLSLGVNAGEVHQLWMTQANGSLCHRGGNGNGWSGTWKTILDSSNYNSYALPLSGGKIKGDVYVNNNLVNHAGNKATWLQSVYPVGSIYISVSSTNPATLFGFGTWVSIPGRMLVGAGTLNDGSTSMTFSAGGTGGTYKHALNSDENGPHNHAFSIDNHVAYGSNGGGSNIKLVNGTAGFYADNKTAISGRGTPFSLMNPYYVVYIWRRTA